MSVVENILLAGYLREHEKSAQIKIPALATSIISVYSKEYHFKVFGERLESLNPKGLDKMNKIDTLNTLKECSKEFNTFISNSSTTRTMTKDPKSFTVSSDIMKQINPIMLATNDKLTDAQTGARHTLFLTAKGKVYALGSNESGQLGLDQDITFVSVPTLIPIEHTIKQIACGELHNLFLTKKGKLLVCGFNYCGQLGMKPDEIQIFSDDIAYESGSESEDTSLTDSDTSDSDDEWEEELNNIVYKPVDNLYFKMKNIRFIDIACGGYHSLGITTNGECFTFGHNGFGNLGNGEHGEYGEGICEPYQLKLNKKFKSASCGKHHAMLSTETNEIIAFGDNRSKQCSNSEQQQFDTPFILSKEEEFGISENCFIEKIICDDYKSKVIIDVFKRGKHIQS